MIRSWEDETTSGNLRHLLERHGLGGMPSGAIHAHLAAQGHRLQTGTIAEASIMAAPSSSNRARPRDPERHQTKTGNPVVLRDEGARRGGRCLGSGAPPGDDGANVSDAATTRALLHEGEEPVGDTGYQGVGKRTGNARWARTGTGR